MKTQVGRQGSLSGLRPSVGLSQEPFFLGVILVRQCIAFPSMMSYYSLAEEVSFLIARVFRAAEGKYSMSAMT
jgi:hypothetical protein